MTTIYIVCFQEDGEEYIHSVWDNEEMARLALDRIAAQTWADHGWIAVRFLNLTTLPDRSYL